MSNSTLVYTSTRAKQEAREKRADAARERDNRLSYDLRIKHHMPHTGSECSMFARMAGVK